MSDLSSLLAPIRDRVAAATEGPWEIDSIESGEHGVFAEEHHRLGCGTSQVAGFMTKANAEFLIGARTDIPRLLAALDAVLALHKPKTLWTHPNWTGSFDTFDICAECGRIEAGQLRKSREEWSYRESLWPCPTIAAVTDALEGTK